jgi:hypothetical protein
MVNNILAGPSPLPTAREISESSLGMTPLEAAVLDIMVDAGRALSVREIAERLAADYDKPPTRASVLAAHAARRRTT